MIVQQCQLRGPGPGEPSVAADPCGRGRGARGSSPGFDRLHAQAGRLSIAPEKLLCASTMQIFYLVHSGRQLSEQLDCNVLLRWSVGLSMGAPVATRARSARTETVCSGRAAPGRVAVIIAQARVRPLSRRITSWPTAR